SLTRCASAVETPGRSPASTSARFTHSSSVCGTQPILGAIDSTAAQSDGYSPRCSCTIRTARSRTSGENFFDLFMGSILSEVGASTNPGAVQHLLLALLVALSSGAPQASPAKLLVRHLA